MPAITPAPAPGSGGGGTGAKGDPGQSAYQTWLALGNTGTEAQFIESLKVKGDPGNPGNPGTPGTPGQSAYQVWLAAGNSGTQADFIASLRGPVGPASTVPGPQGNPGQPGAASTVPGPAGQRGTKRHAGSGAPGTVTGAIPGDEYLNVATGDLYGYDGTAWAMLLNIKGASGTGGASKPRGTGGTMFRAVTRTPGTNIYTDLLPSSPAAAFDDAMFRVLGLNNTIGGPGEDVEITGSGLLPNKTYHVEFPTSATTPNMRAIPGDAPPDWPTGNAAIVNVNRRYREVGTTYADGDRLWMTVSSKPVELSEAAAPITVRRLDVAGLPYNTDLITSGHLTRLVQAASGDGAGPRLLASGDAGVPATWAASPIIKDIGGTSRGVYLREQPYGADDYRFPTDWVPQLGGEMLLELEGDGSFGLVRPRLFFCSSGGITAGTPGALYTLKIFTDTMLIAHATSDGRTISSDTNLSVAVSVPFTANELWNLRVRVDEASKKVSARAWKTGVAEPSAWQIDGFAVPGLTAGRWGWAFRNGVNAITRAALAPNGETATHA